MLNIFDYIFYLYIQFQMDLYDQFLYTPLQTSLLPVVCKIPRTVVLRNKTYTVFTANIVSYSRTLLVIPIAVCLKYEHIASFSLNILPLLGSFSFEIIFLIIYDLPFTHKVPVPHDCVSIGHPARLSGSRGWDRG